MLSLPSLTAIALLAGAAIAQDCVLTVPPNPLTAAGLATPYQVSGCDQRTLATASFVECAILSGGSISIYHPLIINTGDKAGTFAPPVPATVPAGSTTACWFGTNGASLTLTGGSAGCVNGLGKSIFGQFASCGGDVFMKTAEAAVAAGTLQVPALATGIGGQCPTTRDFRIVDQDQSDNVVTTYLLTGGNILSQNTPAASKASGNAKNATVLSNGSDNGLVDEFIDPALGCTPWMAPSVTAPTGKTPALALNELQGNTHPPAGGPALVPLNDPMVLIGTTPSLEKTNLYRAAVGQPLAANAAGASGTTYCKNFMQAGIFIQTNMALFAGKTSPAPDVANNLYTFLAQRFATSLSANGGLNCLGLFNFAQPVAEGLDGNGVVTSASINTAPLTAIMNGQMVASGTVSTANPSSTPNSATVVTATSIGSRPPRKSFGSRPVGASNAGIATSTAAATSAAAVVASSGSAPAVTQSSAVAGGVASSPTSAASAAPVSSVSTKKGKGKASSSAAAVVAPVVSSSAAAVIAPVSSAPAISSSAVARVSSLMSSFLSSVASGISANPTSALPIATPSSSSKAGKAGKGTPTTMVTAVANAASSSAGAVVSAPAASAAACSFSKNAQGLVFDGTTAYFPIPSEFAQFLEGAL